MSSLREEYEKTTHPLVNSIREEFRHPASQRKVWVLVEGDTDRRLYKKLLDGEAVSVEVVFESVDKLLSVFEQLRVEIDRIVAIRDADFLHLEGSPAMPERLFLTDHHDAEMMLVACDRSFSSLVAEFATGHLEDFSGLRGRLLGSIVFLGGLRWLNDKRCLILNFKSLNIGAFYDGAKLSMDEQGCVDKITERSPDRKATPTSAEVNALSAQADDYYNLCNGHDFVKAFVLFAKSLDKRNISADHTESALRAAFHKEDFQETKLYLALRGWQQTTGHELFR